VLKQISDKEKQLFSIIAQAGKALGYPVYLVGGYVRDLLLERPCTDVDVVCVGSGIKLAEAVASRLSPRPNLVVYKRFGTAMIQHREYQIEFVGARKESYRSDSRKPIVENGTLEDDQKRRDFTINALAISLNKEDYGKLIDPFEGRRDLKQRILRTPLDPDKTFSDDPLRMMRAIRFASQLGFTIEDETLRAIPRNRERIRIVSKERITTELNKILMTEKPSVGFKLLFDTGLLEIIFPELHALQGVEVKKGIAHKDNFYHTLEVLDRLVRFAAGYDEKSLHQAAREQLPAVIQQAAQTELQQPSFKGERPVENLWLRWAALLHDIAKPPTKRFEENAGWTFHGHEMVGARMVKRIFKRMKLPLDEKMRYVQKLVRLHLRPISLTKEEITDSAVRRLLFEAGEDLEDLMLLARADITSKNDRKVKRYVKNYEYLYKRLQEVEAKDHLRNWQPPISGEEIMKTFNIPPSKTVGLIKEAIRDAILEGEIPNERQAAYTYMLQKGKELLAEAGS